MPEILDVPQIQPFQFGSPASGVDSSVNLFRGSVGFTIPLVSLTGRNGLDIMIAALYRSDVATAVQTRNLTAPTSVLGLGWSMPTDRIEVRTDGSGDDGNRYFFVRDETSHRLYRNTVSWQRGNLDPVLAGDLDGGRLTPAVLRALAAQGLRVDSSATVTVLTAGGHWALSDAVHEFDLDLRLDHGTGIAVLDGGRSYEMQGYDFSRIQYYPGFERWEITYANGMTSVFGGHVVVTGGERSSAGQTVDWAVRIGNWAGPGIVTHSAGDPDRPIQSQYARAWRFASGRTVWDDKVTFEYDQVRQRVGPDGLSYTKATYLSRIVDVFGQTVTFGYGEKTYEATSPDAPREYADPNKATPDDGPDAFQSQYETRYLSGIEVAGSQGEVLYRLAFDYTLERYAPVPPPHSPLYGDTVKRTLAAISKEFSKGHAYPEFRLGYAGPGETNPGALTTITYPEGSTVEYTYSAQELTHCARDLRVDNPLPGSSPRVWFGSDYAVVAWYAPGTLYLTLYTWVGRWQPWTPPARVIHDDIDLDSLSCEVAEDHAVVHYQRAGGEAFVVRAFHKDPRVVGAWLEPAADPATVRSTDCTLVSGDGFFAVADRIRGTVTTFTWDPLSTEWRTAPLAGHQPPKRPDTVRLFLSAVNHVLMLLVYDKVGAPGHKHNVLTLHHLDELRNWAIGDTRDAPEITLDQSDIEAHLTWTPLPWAIVATFVTNSTAAALNYSLAVYRWGGADGDAYRFADVDVFAYSVETSSPSRAVTIPYVANAAPTGLVASGPHLLRFNGEQWLRNEQLALRLPITDDTVFWFTVGDDVVLKTENGPDRVIGALQVFDPDTETTRWSRPAVSLFHSAPVGERLFGYFPTSADDFVTWNADVYTRGTSRSWQGRLDRPVYALPSGTNTSSLINRGPEYMVYQVRSEDGERVLGTQVLTMTNGTVRSFAEIAERYFSLVSPDGRLVAGVDGKIPGGGSTFVTYLPLDKEFTAADSIRLFRYLGDSIDRPIVSYPATQVTIDDGFQRTVTRYSFDAASAACDYSGAIAKYYRTTVSKDDAGSTVHTFFNSLNGQDGIGNLTTSSYLDGTLRTKAVYDASGALIASAESEYEVVTTVATEPGGPADTPLFGAVVRVVRASTMRDGVTSSTGYDYDAAGGGVCRQTMTAYDASGVPVTHRSVKVYGYQVYPALWYLNDRAAVVQSKATISTPAQAETVTSCTATTYAGTAALGATEVPAVSETFVWRGGSGPADFDFGSRTIEEGPSRQWFRTGSVTLRSPSGLVLQQQAPIGKTQSTVYSWDESLIVASFSDAGVREQEAFYYGFETYESPGSWTLGADTPVVDTMSWAGVRCLSVPGGTTGSPLVLTPQNQDRSYLFSVRANSGPAYDPARPAGWTVELSAGATVLDRQILPVPATGDWAYCLHRIDLAPDSGQTVTVTLRPFNSGAGTVFFDDVGFAPLDHPLHVSVYDTALHRTSEELGPYEATLRRRYDSLGRITAQTGHADELLRVVAPFLSRQVDGAFHQAEPNAVTSFQPRGATYLDRFRNDGVLAGRWTSPDLGAWVADRGTLHYRGAGPGMIELSHPELTRSYVAHVALVPDGPPVTGIGLTAGTDLTVGWSAADRRWTITDRRNGVTVPGVFASPQPGEDLVLVVGVRAVLFYADGRLAAGYLPAQPVSGAFGLFTDTPADFREVFVAGQPETGTKFFDGAGKERQGQFLSGKRVTVTQSLYADALEAVTTMPATLGAGPGQILAYRPDAVTGFDWTTGVLTGAIADALPDAEGYPYSRRVFERSPLARVVEIGAPGKDFAITGAGSHTVRYTYTCNDGTESGLPAGQYAKTVRRDQNGRTRATLTDAFGGEVLTVTAAESIAIHTGRQTTYSPTGRTDRLLLPNHYRPPAGSTADDWIRTTVVDLLGRVVSVDDADGGRTTFVHDDEGRARFVQNPVQAESRTVLYRKYDQAGRIAEEGTFPYTWDAAALQSRAADPDWPGRAESAVARRRCHYDGDGSTVVVLGNLTRVEVLDPDGVTVAVRTDQQFDHQQRLSAVTVTLVADQVTFTTGYTYDNIGAVAGVTYPSGRALSYERDDSGRVTAIRDAQRNLLLEAGYNAGDQVVFETNHLVGAGPQTTVHGYNAQGWRTSTTSEFFTETLDYTNDGHRGTGYYDGSVASRKVTLTVPSGSTVPTELSYRFAYDDAYRLTVAECTWADHVVPEWSLGLTAPINYDANGNFIAVDQETYGYEAGTDFARNTTGTADADFTRDANGATLSAKPRGIADIEYDLFSGRPTALRTTAGGVLALGYDAHLNRVSKAAPDGTRHYARNLSGTVLAEQLGAEGGSRTREFLYGPTGLFGTVTDGRPDAVLKDHLRSPRVILDADGKVAASYQYLPFGALIRPDAAGPDPLRNLFGGYEYDPETGLYWAGARFYDPILRRFYGTDPKNQFASPYVFAGNNPLNLVDPDGEASWWAALIGAIFGAIVTIATGGVGAVLLGTEVAVSAAVGAVAGATGALTGDALTAGISGEKFTGTRALVDVLSGFAGGLVGAGVGGAAGRGAINTLYSAGYDAAADIPLLTRVGTATSMITGGISGAVASSAVSSAMTGQAFFSKETALNIAIGAIAGAGGALMGSGAHFGWFRDTMPVQLRQADFGRIVPQLDTGVGGERLYTMVSPAEYNRAQSEIVSKWGTKEAVFRLAPAANAPTADVIALHGVGRFVFPWTTSGYRQPMSAGLFAQYLGSNPYFAPPVPGVAARPLKLSICFSALPGRLGSVGQTLASATGRTTYAGRGLVYPRELAQNWIRFDS